MEYNRKMHPEDVKKILSQFKIENKCSLDNIRELSKEHEKISTIGKKYIDKRNEYFCGEIRNELTKYLDNEYHKKGGESLTKIDLYKHKYQKCLNFSKNPFIKVHEETENFISNFKKNQKKSLDKCFIFQFDDKSIKDCLQKKILKKEEKLYKLVRQYPESFKEFIKDIYY